MEELGSLSNNDAIRLLKDELAKRKQRNAGYSLRAFAQSLKISPAQLSQLISGKRNFTSKTLQQISKSLHLSPEEENNLHRQVLIPAKAHAEQKDKRQLQEDEFKVIAEWYHFAILSLSKVRGAKADPYWISSRLGISVVEAREALTRLIRLGVLEDSRNLKRKARPLNVTSDRPSRAIQSYHHKILNLAIEKLPVVPLHKRDYSAMTFLADAEKIPSARKMVEEFQDRLVDYLQTPNAKEVFVLACQIFSLEKD